MDCHQPSNPFLPDCFNWNHATPAGWFLSHLFVGNVFYLATATEKKSLMDVYLHQPDIFNGLDRSQCNDKALWSVGVRDAVATYTYLPRACLIGGYSVGSLMVDRSKEFDSHLAAMLSDIDDIVDPFGRLDPIGNCTSHL